ncbi:hypothetical protein ACTMTI_07310 [Nonomuraea sp. H19]|uniref:hypothetical protein n=1 Tax=Nonomuraea sp. H19 TaxID=3452206 RepID=UPI003F89F8F5
MRRTIWALLLVPLLLLTACTGSRRVSAAEFELRAREVQHLGEEGGAGYVAQADHPDTTMARIALRPTWVGILDFQNRLPEVMGG